MRSDESEVSGMSEIISKYQKLFNVEEYIGEYTSEEEDVRHRVNVDIKEEDEDLAGPSYTQPKRETDTTGFMTPEEYENDEYYNPNADRYFGTSDNEAEIPNLRIPDMINFAKGRKSRKQTKIPKQYRPRDNPYDYENRILDLDCQRFPEKEIDGWIKQMQLIVQTNRESIVGLEDLEAYLDFHMTGRIRK